jgi:hypothetical protein
MFIIISVLLSACGSKNSNIQLINCDDFKIKDKLIVPRFKYKTIDIQWGVDSAGTIVGLDNDKLVDLVKQNYKIRKDIKIIYKYIDNFNKRSYDGNSTNK